MAYRIIVTFIGARGAIADSDVIGPTPKVGDKLVAICDRRRVPVIVTKVTLTPLVDQVEVEER